MAEAMNAVVELNLHASQDSQLTYGLVRLTRVWEQIQALGNELMAVVQEEAKRKVRPTEVDLSAVLNALKNDPALRLYEQAGGYTRYQVDAPLPRVLTDPQMLHSLLLGLIKRAAVRRSSGGEVRVRAREYKAQVWIEISDDGLPADDANLLQIIDETMADIGTGLSPKESLLAGLDFVRAKAFLERLDGQLWVGGEGSYGSKIIVCLPVIKTGVLEEGLV
jgi:signal transduction histidine kinase